MSLDSSCAVAISSLNEPECSPSHTPTAISPSTDMPAVEKSSDQEPAQVSDALIGGIVAVVIVLTITLLCHYYSRRNRRGEVSPKNNSDRKYDCDVCQSIKL